MQKSKIIDSRKYFLVTDLDGTLLFENKIHTVSVALLKRLVLRGKVVLNFATGRHFFAIKQYLKLLDGCVFSAILCDGAQIRLFTDKDYGKVIYEKRLSFDVVLAVLDYLLKYFPMVWPQVHADDTIYVREDDPFSYAYYPSIGVKCDSLKEYLVSKKDALRVIVYGRNKDIILVKQSIKKRFDDVANFVCAGNKFLDILPLKVSKGEALNILVDYLKVKRDKTIVIGDHYNDFEMLSMAGTSVVVSDAPLPLRKKADIIVLPVSRIGVKALFETLS